MQSQVGTADYKYLLGGNIQFIGNSSSERFQHLVAEVTYKSINSTSDGIMVLCLPGYRDMLGVP